MEPIVLVHGGAGNICDQKVPSKLEGVRNAAKKAYKILERGGTAKDAVEEAVKILENDEAMNAGRGAVLNSDGEIEMDASIMDGETLEAGAVGAVKNIAHPITLARMVMEKTPHVFLVGTGANRFAEEIGMEILPPGALVTKDAENAWNYFKKYGTGLQGEAGEIDNYGEVGTVGAVAIDCNGHLAAATSTGGLNGKIPGRLGDTPIIGSGTYADDNFGAISSTGHGETIMKICLANGIIHELEKGMNAQKATQSMLNKMKEKFNQNAGAICISKKGEVGIGMTTKRMSWAYRKCDKLYYGINEGEQDVEVL